MSDKKTSCRHRPEETTGAIGMYHCPDCGVMVVARVAHPTDEDCKFVVRGWEPPIYNEVD